MSPCVGWSPFACVQRPHGNRTLPGQQDHPFVSSKAHACGEGAGYHLGPGQHLQLGIFGSAPPHIDCDRRVSSSGGRDPSSASVPVDAPARLKVSLNPVLQRVGEWTPWVVIGSTGLRFGHDSGAPGRSFGGPPTVGRGLMEVKDPHGDCEFARAAQAYHVSGGEGIYGLTDPARTSGLPWPLGPILIPSP